MKYITKKNHKKSISFGNRGMGLEQDINDSNKYYLETNRAVIYKRPTDITVKKVEYPNNKYTKITDGYYKANSTTDYNGIYKGLYIDFEAKETMSKTSFPLANIHNHQLEHMKRINNHGGVAFIIIRFKSLNMNFLCFYHQIEEIMKTRKSLPLDYLETNCYKIKEGLRPRLNYLDILDKIYFKGELYEENN